MRYAYCYLCHLLLPLYPPVTVEKDTTHGQRTPMRLFEGHQAMSAIRVLRAVRTESGWRRVPVAKIGDVIDWGRVKIGRKFVAVTSGTFYLEYRDPKKVRRAVELRGNSALSHNSSYFR